MPKTTFQPAGPTALPAAGTTAARPILPILTQR